MTQLLEKAIAQLQQLSERDQDAIASLILAEMADDLHWEEAFSASQPQLSQMAEKVRGDIRTGRTREAGVDEL